jgi:hypothetical protein
MQLTSGSTGSGFISPAYFLVPGISSGAHVGNFFGKAFSDADTCYTALHWLGDGNTSNTINIGCFNHDDLIVADMNGNVTIGGGAQTLYRCTTAGALPVGALTTATGNCGASTDTGLRLK